MFAVQDIVVFSVVAGVLAAALLWAIWPWSPLQRRFLIAGVTTFLGFMAWNFTLNATQAVPNFDVDAPIIRLSWADAGSGVCVSGHRAGARVDHGSAEAGVSGRRRRCYCRARGGRLDLFVL